AVEAGEVTPTKGPPEREAIVKYNVRVDEDLYEWLRTTAFFARVSINTLLIAGLVRFREAHPDTPASRKPLAHRVQDAGVRRWRPGLARERGVMWRAARCGLPSCTKPSC